MEIKNIARCAFMTPDPKLMTVDLTQIERNQAERRREMEKANPPKPEPARVEYNRLRQQLYSLQQTAKSAETSCNNKADHVRGLEQRINDLLKRKQKAHTDGHLGDERICEHQIQLLENELLDAQEDFLKAKHWNSQAARALKAFDGHARLAELKAEIDKTLPVAKSDNVPK